MKFMCVGMAIINLFIINGISLLLFTDATERQTSDGGLPPALARY